MGYIVITEQIGIGSDSTSCLIQGQGLQKRELDHIKQFISNKQLVNDLSTKADDSQEYFEVDVVGVKLLNMLYSYGLNYKVVSQSMVIEKTEIGGRTIQIQKTVWTLIKAD